MKKPSTLRETVAGLAAVAHINPDAVATFSVNGNWVSIVANLPVQMQFGFSGTVKPSIQLIWLSDTELRELGRCEDEIDRYLKDGYNLDLVGYAPPNVQMWALLQRFPFFVAKVPRIKGMGEARSYLATLLKDNEPTFEKIKNGSLVGALGARHILLENLDIKVAGEEELTFVLRLGARQNLLVRLAIKDFRLIPE